MFKKPLFVVIVAVLACTMILSACGAPATAAPAAVQPTAPAAAATAAPAASNVVTITMWHGFNAHEVTFLAGIIKKYWDPTHPNIHVITVGEKHNDAMLTAMSGGDSPDLVMSESSEAITLWASQGAIMDLTGSSLAGLNLRHPHAEFAMT